MMVLSVSNFVQTENAFELMRSMIAGGGRLDIISPNYACDLELRLDSILDAYRVSSPS